jgi:hypothetical protein
MGGVEVKIYCMGLCPVIVHDEETARMAGVWVEDTARTMMDADRPPPSLDMGITRVNGFGEFVNDDTPRRST